MVAPPKHSELYEGAIAACEFLSSSYDPAERGKKNAHTKPNNCCYMQISSPTIIVERAGSYAWSHKSWRIREEFARTVTSAIGLFASTELTLQRAVLPSV